MNDPPGAAAGAGTVYVLAPDYDEPSGGVRRLYHWVDVLCALGYRAFVVHQRRGFRCSWFEHSTPILAAGNVRVGRGDLLVVPEQIAQLNPGFAPGVPKVLLNLDLTLRDPTCFADPDYVAIAGVSEYATNLASRAFPDKAVHRVRHGIDTTVFHPPAAPPSGEPVVSYMPRKHRGAAQLLAIARSEGLIDGWKVRSLDGLGEREVGDALRATTIFLSFSRSEGFGRPPLEAMACGCIVVGFPGQGGTEYFLRDHSFPVRDGDLLHFADVLAEVRRLHDRDPDGFRAIGDRAAAFALDRYDPAHEREDLANTFALLMRSAPEHYRAADEVALESLNVGPSEVRKSLHYAKRAIAEIIERRR